jgi:hypothetical protein
VGDDAGVLPRDGPTDGEFDGFGDELQVVGHLDGHRRRAVVIAAIALAVARTPGDSDYRRGSTDFSEPTEQPSA